MGKKRSSKDSLIHWKAKLTRKQIQQAVEWYYGTDRWSQVAIARKLGVSQATISNLIHAQTYRSVIGEILNKVRGRARAA